MASSSSSTIQKSFKYDVFLSFRGEDTRKNFVDHLYHALHQKSIYTYKDDKRIKKGERISDELIRSIEDSKFYLIVLSKNYASSSWCLDELVKIMECQKTTLQTAYPIFYDIEPSEVRKQSGTVGEAFAKFEKAETAEKWRGALKEAADLAGWELKNTANGHEAKFIQKVVEEISQELRAFNLGVDGKLVGMETRIKNFVSSVETCFDDVRMIGIKGIGGSGKTTLARVVFDQLSFRFEGASFVENVREVSKASLSGLKSLQKQVLSDVLNDQGPIVSSVHDGKKMMKKVMRGRKVLLVLDDVDHIDQLEALAGERDWFKPGSTIIITTRDEQVLVAHGVNLIHDVNLLSYKESICLFSRYAFGKEIPIQGYEGLSRKLVAYAAGLPLTVRVLGSSLCGKSELEWKDALERLKTIPLKETLEKLELSYISLDDDYKEIFLHIACILKGQRKDDAIRKLESCGFHARNGLRVLEQKSLITISKYEYLGMHDHIEEMGKNIVRRLHPDEPNKHSRLWIDKEIKDILATKLGTNATRCIKLWTLELDPKIVMKGLENMKELRFLDVYCGSQNACLHSNWNFNEDRQYFSNALRYLSWYRYPFQSLPKTFQANDLVALQMPFSKIVQLWERGERKVVNKLRFLDLRDSMLRTLDLGLTPNLEVLCLETCKHLVELHIPAECLKLRFLDLSNSKLRTLNLQMIPNLETLILRACYHLIEIHVPIECQKLTSLDLSHSKLRNLDLGLIPKLEKLSLMNCHDLVELHTSVGCVKLQSLNLSHSKLRTLDLRLALNLETLYLDTCDNLVELCMPVGCQKLKFVKIWCSKLSTLDLGLFHNLETLSLSNCDHLIDLHMPVGCVNLKSVEVWCSKLSTIDLGLTPNLEKLSLNGCHDLAELQMPVECIKLRSLDLSHSKLKTFDLRLTPNLEMLRLNECDDLEELHIPLGCLNLTSIYLRHSKLKSFDLGLTLNLETLILAGCHDLVALHMPVKSLKLRFLDLSHTKFRTLDLRQIPNLETLSLRGCDGLVELHLPVGCLKLTSLDISHSKLETLDLGLTPNLEKLSLAGCHDLVELHMPAECLKLRFLHLTRSKLRTLDLVMTPSLERLDLKECYNLIEIHAPPGCLKKLVYLDLSGCGRFKSFLFDKRFEPLEANSSSELHLIAEPIDICPLHPDSNLPKFEFTCIYKEHLNSSFGNLEKLISLGLCACTNLDSFSETICALRFLRKLTLEGSIPQAPKDLDQIECLEELNLSASEMKHLPDSICMLKHLKSLELKSCWLLEKLPENLGRLECLEKLILTDCKVIRDIPNSICKMKRLEYFHLPQCIRIEKLPNKIGRLECLKELNIEGTSIRRLPLSIFRVKGLHITGSRWLLPSCSFISF